MSDCPYCDNSSRNAARATLESESLRAENTRLAETLLEHLDTLRAIRTLCEERRDQAARNDASYWHSGAAWLACEVLAELDK